ncbi:B3/B4 domain-containing protein [Actinokineospora sp. HUAS TT18]|uniref:B3/B4 domain-containing protein n=1 Tax=Actinokineospora sp. HUAS TT18 TaxID=3447451 RepID=UPI003F51D1CC
MGELFSLSSEVGRDFPDAQVRFVRVMGLRNGEHWLDVEARLASLERRVATGEWTPFDKSDHPIASWHDAYRKFGTNPNRNRPSVDALSRRLAKSFQLPRIHGAVNAYNLVSVLHGTPAGAFDLDKIDGPVVIRYGTADDQFVPLGEPDAVEAPGPTEVIYAQGNNVLTRHWNYRDSDHTKVTEGSKNVVFLLERISSDAMPDERMQRAQEELAELLRPYADQVVLSVIEPETPSTSLEMGEPGFMV